MDGEICKEFGSTPCNPNCTKGVDSNNELLAQLRDLVEDAAIGPKIDAFNRTEGGVLRYPDYGYICKKVLEMRELLAR